MSIVQKINALCSEMKNHQLDFYLVPSIDPHNSEYVPECWQRRTWVSNFDGSAGEALIGLDQAYLSTDGRYFLQAEQQLDSKCFTLLKQSGFVPATEEWLSKHATGKKVGIDSKVIGIARFTKLQKMMQSLGGELVVIDENLIDKAKKTLNDNIILPASQAFALDYKFTGMSVSDKLKWLRSELLNKNVDSIAINVLDEIAWLFNIRGTDVDFNPYVISYAVISNTQAILFVDTHKIDNNLAENLKTAQVEIKPYDEFAAYLANITGTVLLDDSTASQWMLQLIQKSAIAKLDKSPIVMKKAIKNEIEKNGMRTAHHKDAVAMINFFYWLENNWQNNIDEISASDKLAEFRYNEEHCQGLSFATISGYESNGAIIHYRATPETSKQLGDNALYLLDSGGQYLDGTTDTTRTLHLGLPTEEEKHHYTLVLKGHLALTRAVFPEGTRGDQLDILARQALWNESKNYRHGTGHGVGCFLGVHEGPHRISPAPSFVALVPGMVVSNEPGYYVDGRYGIRIENLIMVRELSESEYGKFYGFEDLTLIPYCKRLINVALLNRDDIEQIRDYYQRIKEIVLPKLGSEQQKWLLNELSIDGV